MSDAEKGKFVLRQIEFVNNSVISHSKPERSKTGETLVMKTCKVSSEKIDACFYSLLKSIWELEKVGIEVTRVNLCGRAHFFTRE